MTTSPIKNIDYIELYVFNAFQSACFYKAVFGFNIIGHAGPETGITDKTSYILEQGNIRLLISSPRDRKSAPFQKIIDHDEYVKDVAFTVTDIRTVYEQAIKAGAKSVLSPTLIEDGRTKLIKACIQTFGNTIHTFIERDETTNFQLPYYEHFQDPPNTFEVGLEDLDHIAIAVETGQIELWKNFYSNVFNFHTFHKEDIFTSDNGMKSIVVSDANEVIKFVLVEGISKSKTSQIDNYISYNGCSGIQHLAFSTKNIYNAATLLTKQGINFLKIPESYYADLPDNLKEHFLERMTQIKDLNILLDAEKNGYLLQMFTRPLQNFPTFFIEIIQRENSQGFGSNNIKALFRAVEKDQQKALVNA
ncbi:4-hydroxyphenylpyruvate dioxygenase [Geitlerinema splendidum]|nr:4-hydroxyphenylpyruvate dioxygenase [Geitlerinema splendidum]